MKATSQPGDRPAARGGRAKTGERGLIVRVGAPTRLRVEGIRDKLSSGGRVVTRADAYRTLVLVGLARLGDTTAKPRWSLGELRRLSREGHGASAKNVSVGLDKLAKRQVEVLRRRLSTTRRRSATAAVLRTLVLVGLDYAETLPPENLGGTLLRFVESVTPTSRSRSKASAAPKAAREDAPRHPAPQGGDRPDRSGRS
jgi:hypothetical protein